MNMRDKPQMMLGGRVGKDNTEGGRGFKIPYYQTLTKKNLTDHIEVWYNICTIEKVNPSNEGFFFLGT